MGCSLSPAAIFLRGGGAFVRSCRWFRVELRVTRRADDRADRVALRVRREERDDMAGTW